MRSDMTRHMSDDLLDEIEQRAMAERILLNILRATLAFPEAMDRSGVATMISAAATERQRHGDYSAADLLRHWRVMVDGWD